MAIKTTLVVGGEGTAGGAHIDSAVTATAVRNVTNGKGFVRGFHFNNLTPATAVHFQMFDNVNPTVGTTLAKACIPLKADSQLLVVSLISDGLQIDYGLSYAATDDPHGATVTAGSRDVYILHKGE